MMNPDTEGSLSARHCDKSFVVCLSLILMKHQKVSFTEAQRVEMGCDPEPDSKTNALKHDTRRDLHD